MGNQNEKLNITAILLCGGESNRYGKNKLLEKIDGKEIAKKSLDILLSCDEINDIIVVTHNEKIINIVQKCRKVKLAISGETRFHSVWNGLNACKKTTDIVIIHDGARPFVSKDAIRRSIKSAKELGSGVLAIPQSDTLRLANNGVLGKTIPRETVVRLQTPQTFNFERIFKAYRCAEEEYKEKAKFTDDSSVYSKYIGDCHYICGESGNIKITYQNDIVKPFLTGVGYDIHRLVENRKLILCGVKIPFSKGLLGHSDADVPIHALMDSILSALGKKDIGHYFPTDDPKYSNANSVKLLQEILEIVKNEDREIENISISIIAEKPKLAPFIDEMRETLSKAIGISVKQIGITVTTNEKVGEIGKGEAIASIVSVAIK